MKSKYLRHEYSWSNHCITGNSLGWGVTASSCPKDKAMLGEIEKIASAAEPDRSGEILVEELSYHPVCGFIKMTVIPWDAGEDKRKNKKVFLYQPEEKEDNHSPECYFAPEGTWEENGEYIAPVSFEQKTEKPEDIFIEMHVYDRLPDFLRAVFWCLFEKKQGLNFIAPHWEKEEFASRAGKLMYALHCILPEPLRKRAGYVSYTEHAVNREPFYFSKKVCGEKHINLSDFEKEDLLPPVSKMEEYFFYHLSEFFVKDYPLYQEFWRETEPYLKESGGGNEQRKLEWLFYIFCRKHGKEALDKEFLLPGLPELFYWASKERELKDAAAQMISFLHKEPWTAKEKEEYIKILLEGFTKRAQSEVCGELDWILQRHYKEDKELFLEQLEMIKEKNELIYAALLAKDIGEEKKWQQAFFKKNTSSFSAMEKYAGCLLKTEIAPEVKDQLILAGINLLNQDLFNKENYIIFDSMMIQLKKKKQWAEILKDFVSQLEREAENLGNEQLETACYVEKLLMKYAPKQASGILEEEDKKRRRREKAEKKIKEDAYYDELDSEDEEDELPVKGLLKDSLLAGYPQGFLTGCALYLANYSLMIGHWKIALGMMGMWILFMLNFYYLMMHKKKKYPFWKNIGMCLLEGYIIEFAASLFLSQKIRLYYFILLGIAALGVQMINIFRKRTEKEEE